MIIENPAALQFIINEQIYLSKNDVGNLAPQAPAAAEEPVPVVAAEITPEPIIAETPVAVEPTPVIETPVLSFNYLGKNTKGFLIICHYPGLDIMDEKHLAALTNTLQRKELSVDDVAVLNLAKHADASIEQIHTFFKPRRLLLLGDQSRLPGWDVLTLNLLTNISGYTALYTHSFTDMMGDRDKTKAFWEQMKQL